MEKLPEQRKLPSLADLYSDDIEVMRKHDELNWLCNQPPKPEWVKEHPYIKGHKYVPIGVIETMLQKIFKQHRIEVLREGALFNAIAVTVRLHYMDITSNEWTYHDGVGAIELQTEAKSGALKTDFSNINRGAVAMALPLAKSLAIKDAADHIGSLFGRDLNRKDYLDYAPDKPLSHDELQLQKERSRVLSALNLIKTMEEFDAFILSCGDLSDLNLHKEILNKSFELKGVKL